MKTDEQKWTYETDAQESLEMLGKGYEPTLEIEAPKKVTERRDGRLVESERPAFVKIYTSFKEELKTIDGDDLKVWLYLALSINRFSGEACPGLRKIAEDTDISINSVRNCIDRLEDKNLLETRKRDGKNTTYRPSDYASVKKETVSKFDTVPQTVSNFDTGVLKNEPTVLSTRRDSAQLEELDLLDGIMHYQLKPKGLKDAFAKHFRLTPNWEAKYNRQFMEWLVGINATPEQVEHAAKLWKSDKRFNWSVPTLRGIQEHWLELIATVEPNMEHKPVGVIQTLLDAADAVANPFIKPESLRGA